MSTKYIPHEPECFDDLIELASPSKFEKWFVYIGLTFSVIAGAFGFYGLYVTWSL